MNLNNFTLKAQESVQQAFNIAEAKGQQSIECAHLLKGILIEAESTADFLFGKLGVEKGLLSRDIERLIDSYPKVMILNQGHDLSNG
jgi:ATP-dependent Clp protease ATP-binding subunit ClpB